MTQVDRIFFFRAACVSVKKKIVSHVSPALKYTISLKIITKFYYHTSAPLSASHSQEEVIARKKGREVT